jgi:glycosyltransferase involved in cell wall biosynthesis
MIIAVNARFFNTSFLEGVGYFTKEVFTRIAEQNPLHQFHFIVDRPIGPVELPANVTIHVTGPPARHPFLWKIWFDWKIPGILRRTGADVFVSPDGFASLRTKVPQCMVIHDLGFLHYPGAYKKSHLFFFRRYTPRFISKSAVVATVSEFSKQDIMAHYGTDPARIQVVHSAVKEGFRPVDHEQREKTKEQFTGGKEYFIYIGALQPRKNLVNLLKAFGTFKKRQQSEWKLVLAGRLAWKNNDLLELLKTYRYRDDVVLTGYLELEELQQLAASAYALVYPSFFEGFGVPVLEGMKSGVPVLTSKQSSMQEVGGDAALYFDPHDANDMADKLMLIYKREDLRKKLVLAGLERAKAYSWDKTAELMWKAIQKGISR